MGFYEVELGTGYHIYTRYSVQASSEEEAIKKAKAEQETSPLTHHLTSELEFDYGQEFVSIYSQGELTAGPSVQKIEQI